MTRSKVGALFTLAVAATFALAGCSDDSGNGPTPPPGNGGGDPPAAPSSVAASASGPDVEVTWTAPENADSQTVQLSSGNSFVSDASQDVSGSAEQATFQDAGFATTFTVTVSASNDAGSAESDPVEVTTGEIAFNNMLADPNLPASAFAVGSRTNPPNIIPSAMPGGYSAVDVSALNNARGLVMPTDGRTLQATSYAGGVEPGTPVGSAWYTGWTVWDPAGEDSREMGLITQTITDTIREDMTLDAETTWILDGPVFVGVDCGPDGNSAECDPATLTVEPGTTIMGLREPSEQGVRGSMLVVSRGSRIVADANNPDFGGSGTCEKPAEEDVIVMTSDAPRGQRARGDWGGLVINGQARINSGEEASGEGDSGLYGGDDDQDNSGILRGIRVEFAGDDVTAADQLNGIAYQGVGAGTTVCYAQVHYNQDDGTEPFGGTVTQTHMVMTGIGDDSFDGTDGWRGFLQFGIAQQRADDADQGFEFSNNGDTPDASPHSSAVVANVTLVGSGMSLGAGELAAQGSESDVGILLREGSNFRVFNSIATGFGAAGFDVEGGTTAQNADRTYFGTASPSSGTRLEGSILWSNVAMEDADENFTDASGDGYTLEENRQFFLSGSSE